MTLKARLGLVGGPDTHLVVTDGSRELTLQDVMGASVDVTGPMADGGVALCLRQALDVIAALVALDGNVSKLLLLSTELARADITTLMTSANITSLITDREDLDDVGRPLEFGSAGPHAPPALATTWLMTTSGTTATPKIVAHTLQSLVATVKPAKKDLRPVWGLLYEPSRFAGLQVILQSLLGEGSLVAPDRALPISDQLFMLAKAGCTHLSGTPSLWRKLLLSPAVEKLALRQITLGGETADARVLTSLRDLFPQAKVTQIYASTEAGVGFSNHDAWPGFPLHCLEAKSGLPDFRIKDGELWARPAQLPNRAAFFASPAQDEDGYFCTGDSVEVVGERLFFRGRRDAVANVGGIKIPIERVETIVREFDQVQDCQVSMKPSPILGTVLTLQVVARNPAADPEKLRIDVNAWCRSRLPREACPVSTKIVAKLDVNAAGKVSRRP
jgi:acyl-CoA synthetase (AMP-forming)/AMP-acid ligase II